MTELLAIAIGGAIGAVARYSLGEWVTQALGSEFPWGILIINVGGSLAIGVLFVLLVEQALLSPVYRSFLIVGFLGAFTTFSTFSLQVLALMQNGRFLMASTYVVTSVLLSILAVAVGVFVTRQISGKP